jgi:acyl-coenzyme A synthetase/AMP-(fatty) acid ligase
MTDANKKTAIIDIDEKQYTYYDLLKKVAEKTFLYPKKTVVLLNKKLSYDAITDFLALIFNKNIILIQTKDNILKELESVHPNYIIKDNDILECFYPEKRAEDIQKILDKEHPGLILFSSGTTNKPKIILHDLTDILSKYKTSTKDLKILLFLQFDHIGGIDSLLRLLQAKMTIILPKNKNCEYICELVEKYSIEALPANPSFLNQILIGEYYKKYNLKSLKLITFGAEYMPIEILKKLKNIFINTIFQQKYGTSETGAILIKDHPAKDLYFKILGTDYYIKDSILYLRTPANYLEKQLDINDNYFKTGDLVESFIENNQEYIKIIGRKNNVINSGGRKINPIEIEEILYELPYVKDCLVYGEKNALLQYIIVADIVSDNQDKKQIKEYLISKLPRYKIPIKINFKEKILYSNREKKIRIF